MSPSPFSILTLMMMEGKKDSPYQGYPDGGASHDCVAPLFNNIQKEQENVFNGKGTQRQVLGEL